MRALLAGLSGVLLAGLLIVAVAALWYAAIFLGAVLAAIFIGWFISMAIWDIFFAEGDKKKPP